MGKNWLYVIFAAAFSVVAACAGPPDISGVDPQAWSADENGCDGVRQGQVDQLYAAREAYEGLSINTVNTWLGLPDRTRLYERGQKFYYYFTTPGSQCDSTRYDREGSAIVFRFSAVGHLKEVELQQLSK